MVQIIQICRLIGMPLLKSLIVVFFILWHFSVTIVLANSGSYIAGQFAEKEGDFKNASYYYIDLISRGDSEREIITRSVIYAALAGNFEIATAISRKIDDLQLNYPVTNLVIFAEAIRKREKSEILRSNITNYICYDFKIPLTFSLTSLIISLHIFSISESLRVFSKG